MTTYKTRNGGTVEVLMINTALEQPVIGKYGNVAYQWFLSGIYMTDMQESDLDLILPDGESEVRHEVSPEEIDRESYNRMCKIADDWKKTAEKHAASIQERNEAINRHIADYRRVMEEREDLEKRIKVMASRHISQMQTVRYMLQTWEKLDTHHIKNIAAMHMRMVVDELILNYDPIPFPENDYPF